MKFLLVRLGHRYTFRDEERIFRFFGVVSCIIYSIILILPLYYIFVSSFKTNAEIFGGALSLPNNWTLLKFQEAEANALLAKSSMVSIIVTVCAEILTLILAFPAAYAIARIKSPLASYVSTFFSTGFLIPAFAMMVPIVVLISQLGLLYNPLALIIFYPAWRQPFTIIVLVSYFKQVPVELEESAQIDGASRLKILSWVYIPLVKPGVVTVVILNFISIWNEFLFALILLDQKSRTVQVALSILKSERLTDYGMLSAGVLITIVPIIIVFLFFQRQIIGGLYSGAVKG